MKIRHVIPLALMTSSWAFASSEIPDRRDFPVNTKVSPCQDFYQHSCSKVIDSFTLRDDRSRHIFSFSDSSERLLNHKKQFLADLQGQRRLSDRAKDLQTVYGACMNESARAREEKALVRQTQRELSRVRNRNAFVDYLAQQRKRGYHSFVGVGSTANQDEPEYYDFYFIADMKTLPERSYYHNEDLMKEYHALVTLFFTTVGENNPAERATRVLDLEKAFADNYPLPAELRSIFTQKSSIGKDEIKKLYPSFRLDAELKQVPDKVNIRHIIPENYAFVEETLQKADLEALKDLYRYHALSPLMDDAYPEYFKARFEFNHKHLGGPVVRPDRDERCTEFVMGRYRMEIDAELVPKLFPDFPEKEFVQLAEDVRSAIIEGMKTNTWLSDEGRKGAIEKLQSARLQLVQPRNENEWNFNPKVRYRPRTPIENSRLLNLALRDRMFKELGDKRDPDRWAMGPLTVNAYYSPSDNKFVMPIGILQYPFYDPKLPREVNLGAVGAVIGHELGHGIDDQGAKYDAQGRLRQWMSDEDLENFRKNGERFIAQLDAAGHDGRLTLGETIGDWTGVTFAYQAAFPENKGTQEMKQNFFYQYARIWCGTMRPALRERLLKTGPHPLGEARVNEQVKHQAGFKEAFECKVDDPMVLPEKDRIRVW